MNTSEFFERVVYLRPADKSSAEVRKQCSALGVKKMEVIGIQDYAQVMPHTVTFTQDELSELLAFYRVILRAQTDRINRILILKDDVKFRKDFARNEERVFAEMPHEWDMVYWAHESYQPITTEKSERLVNRVLGATGTRALALNNSFYHIFLESARVPLYSLSEHIRSISLTLQVFVMLPPLITGASSKPVDISTKH